MMIELIVMVPAPPMPLIARPKITMFICDATPLDTVRSGLTRFKMLHLPDNTAEREQKI